MRCFSLSILNSFILSGICHVVTHAPPSPWICFQQTDLKVSYVPGCVCVCVCVRVFPTFKICTAVSMPT